MKDNIEIDESEIPKETYDLILYNPPISLTRKEIYKEIEQIQNLMKPINYIWIEPNDDKFSDIIFPYTNQKNLPREKFLGLMKNCDRFITNSSCQYYEASFLMNKENIISIGNTECFRECNESV